MFNSILRTSEAVTSTQAVALREVRKVYGRGDGSVVALDGVTRRPRARIIHSFDGPVGLGQEHVPERGGGTRPADLGHGHARRHRAGGTERAAADDPRRERIGFVFQAFNLLPSLTVAQNIGLPLRLDGHRPRRSTVREVAARVGLEKRLRDRPSQLSGGQQQRVAIARALVTRPEVVFADEPTGALDTRTGREVLALLRDIVDQDRRTVVMVTHDPVAAAYADHVIVLADGRVAATLEAPSADDVAEQLAHLGG